MILFGLLMGGDYDNKVIITISVYVVSRGAANTSSLIVERSGGLWCFSSPETCHPWLWQYSLFRCTDAREG